jgi:lysozyme
MATLTADGLARLEHREGTRATMYRDSAGLPTIGVGHLLTKDELSSGKLSALGVDWHQGLLPEHITALLAHDASAAERAVTDGVRVPLQPAQFDALVSFCFNVGVNAFLNSSLLRVLNTGDYVSVPGQLRRWVYSAGQRDPVLVRRREDEIAQWDTA